MTEEKTWIKCVFVMTTSYRSEGKERNIEVRGTFMFPRDWFENDSRLVDVVDLMKKVLLYYFEQKGYELLMDYLEIPPELFDTMGIEVFRDIKEPMTCKSVFEIVDKDYNRVGGYVEEIQLPKDWYKMRYRELIEIVKSQITMEGRGRTGKPTLGRWLGYSKTEEEYVRDD